MNRRLRVLQVGCGQISKAWLAAATQNPAVELAGLVDLDESVARQRAAEFNLGQAHTATDLERALRTVQPDIVFDCTIPAAHHQVTLAALAHGAHVLGEKPLAASLEQARAMVAAAQQAGKLYAVMQNRRYTEPIRRLRAFLAAGTIGELTTLDCDFQIGAHFGGFREQMPHVLLLDMAIHTFDAARFLSGADPVAVYCHEWNPAGSWYDHGAAAVAIFEMSNGLVYTYRGSWCAEGLNTSWEANWRLTATQGSASWDGAEAFRAQSVLAVDGSRAKLQDHVLAPTEATGKTGGHRGCIDEFIRCVQTGALPETICTDNLKSLAMVFGAIDSAERGQRVHINP